MKLGGSEVLALRLGSKPVVAAYLGSTLVWIADDGTVGLAGALLATTALSGGLTVERSLAGTVAAQAALAANAGVKRPIAGALAAISDASGDLTVSAQVLLHGALNAISALGGGLSVARTLAGTVTALSATAGAASVERVLAGAAAAVSALAGTAKVRRALTGAMGAVSSATAALTVTSAGGTLTQKGYGHVYDTGESANLSMSYANVDGGSAPAAGDLVLWIVMAGDTVAQPIVDLTGSGWTQYRGFDATNVLGRSVIAKVVSSGDISSPPQIVNAPNLGSIAFWAAYSVTGSISSLNTPTPNWEYSGTNAPANQVVDSSSLDSPAVAITFAMASGTDNAVTGSISGAAADITFDTATNQWFSAASENRYMINATIGGAVITFSKSDDGTNNMMFSGYVSVAF